MTATTVELISPANESVQQLLDTIMTAEFGGRSIGSNVSRYNYWNQLSIDDKNYLVNAWNTLDAEYVGVGVCQPRFNCLSSHAPKYLFNAKMKSHLPDAEERVFVQACMKCIAHAFSVINQGSPIMQSWHGIEQDLMPESLFKYPELNKCSCSYPIPTDILIGSERHADSWSSVIAMVDEDESGPVHKMCAFDCYECSETIDKNQVNSHRADGNIYCESCWENMDVYWCDRCEEYSTQETQYSEVRSRDLCVDCYDEYIECSDCEEQYYEDDGHDCDNYSSVIRNYSYKPTPIFWPVHDSKFYYLGIELEVESRNARRSEAAEFVNEFLGDHAYLKEDGSLNNGFEIVTHPHTLNAYHLLDWSFLDKLKSMGVRSWNTSTCGLHVHVGRVAFDAAKYPESEKHMIRFTKFIYDNEQQVTRIAGRTSNYAGFNDKGKIIPKVKNNRQSNDRYSAVNVYPEYTLEVRVFKGSLRKERVLSAIEFVHAAVEFTRDMKIVPKQIPFSWARFITYVTNNQETYPNLFIILNETFARDYNGNEES